MKNYPIRYIARFQIETASALRIGTGNKGALVDNIVARDANGLPYLPATSIAGVLRHTLEDLPDADQRAMNELFGFQKEKVKESDQAKDKGLGSRIFFTDAYLLDHKGKKVLQGLQDIDRTNVYYAPKLVLRDHVAINHKGAAKDHAKYESELVRKGTRFVFEIEMMGTAEEAKGIWQKLLKHLQKNSFRLGAGTRNGFGELHILQYEERSYDFTKETELKAYLNKTAQLSDPFEGATKHSGKSEIEQDQWEEMSFSITPENFFLFGAGESESTPKKEEYFDWSSGAASLKEAYLIPATSIKGALSHRTAYHYNLRMKNFVKNSGQAFTKEMLEQMGLTFDEEQAAKDLFPIDLADIEAITSEQECERFLAEIEKVELTSSEAWKDFVERIETKKKNAERPFVGAQNEAVATLFGTKKASKKDEDSGEDIDTGERGKVLWSDAYLELTEVKEKVFNHVAIDRFTGGGRDGALFTTTALHGKPEIRLNIFVEKTALQDEHIKKAFIAALDDLATGQLQLGGQSTKGHGVFKKH